jgi:hypothetical protein
MTSTAYKTRIAISKEHLDIELLNFARKIGHYGLTNFIEAARQRCHTAITPEYAADLLNRAGFKTTG